MLARRHVERAHAVIVINRCAFSGILNSGPLGGYQQNGNGKIASRWNKEKLVTQILNIHKTIGNRLVVHNQQADVFLRQYSNDESALIYLDPPYYAKGNQLYRPKNENQMHVRLAELLKRAKSSWVLSYDVCEPILNLYYSGGNVLWNMKTTYCVSNVGRSKCMELIIVHGNDNNVVRCPILTDLEYQEHREKLFDENLHNFAGFQRYKGVEV